MTDTVSLWYAFLFFQISALSLITLFRNDLRYVYFAASAAIIGRVFDCSAIFLGFYSYNPLLDPVHVCETPITMAFAEGMGMSMVIFAFEFLTKRFKLKF